MRLRRSHISFSVGLAVRGRDQERLARCLASLQAQSMRPAQVLVVEMAEGPIFKHRDACQRAGVRYLQVEDSGGLFPLARLANIAARQLVGTATHFVKTDVDAIFMPSLLSTLQDRLQGGPTDLLSVRPRRLPEDYSYSPGRPERWAHDAVLARGDEKMWGLCMVHDFDSFGELRGFDEAFVGWGGEDRNYVHRAEEKGCTAEMLELGPVLLHQWHPVANGSRVNGAKHKEWRKRAQRNGPGWGR